MSSLLLLMSSLVFGQGWAQTTFNVDMTCAPEGFENVFVTGPWCGWCANGTYNTMTDPDGDGVYTAEVSDLAGVVENPADINFDGCVQLEDFLDFFLFRGLATFAEVKPCGPLRRCRGA